MTLPNPFFLYSAAGLALLAFGAGWTVRDWRCDAAKADVLEQTAEQTQEMQDEVEAQATTYEDARSATYGVGASIEREIRTIYREVPAPPATCEPDSRIVGLLQGRLDHANASAAGELGE